MQHLAIQFGERAMTRIRRIKQADGQASPRDVIAAILAEALPADDRRRTLAHVQDRGGRAGTHDASRAS
jgi:hypothetical protein